MEQLRNRYELRELGQIKWFLGIRVVREFDSKKLWLIQDSFIDKVAAKHQLNSDKRYPDFPMRDNYLPPSEEETDARRTKEYQQLIGSLAYIATFTRPDVARAHSVLARHLTNPGQRHLAAARHTWRYIIGTRDLALEANGQMNDVRVHTNARTSEGERDFPMFHGSSDASYGDEPNTARSSMGYIFMLAGLPVDWKATIQKTVTKSTTEAELVALSKAGTEMQAWQIFFEGIRFDPGITPQLFCDNQQTVGVIQKDQDKLQTKLKHVRIHQLWVRQEVQQNRLLITWLPTKDMLADGLTKILPRQLHKSFIKHLGLVNISDKLAKLTNDSTSSTQDLLPEDMTTWH